MLLLLVALCSASTHATPLIQWEESGAGVLGVETLDGDSLRFTPVRITRSKKGRLQVHALKATPEEVEKRMDRGERVGARPILSVRLSTPQILSASLGVVIGNTRCDEIDLFCSGHGVLLQIEPGLGGGKASVGYALLVESNGFLRKVFPIGGVDLKATLLETWGPSLTVDPLQTFVGGEIDWTYLFVKFSFGVLHRVLGRSHASAEDDDWLVTAGFGVGF